MPVSARFRNVHRITIRCPISSLTLQAVLQGDGYALESDPSIAPILKLIEERPAFGDFGHYTGVCEVTVGLEAFTSGHASSPTLGTPGKRTASFTATVTTFVGETVDDQTLHALIEAIAAAHPWEVPVIELDSTRLWVTP
jgi:hypothetical protein